jgi:hypothetical protein
MYVCMYVKLAIRGSIARLTIAELYNSMAPHDNLEDGKDFWTGQRIPRTW